MPDDLLGTEYEFDLAALGGIVAGDVAAIRALFVAGLNFVPGVGSILAAVASIWPWEIRGPTRHPTQEQGIEVATQVANSYIAATNQAGINWLASVNGKPLYKGVIDNIQDVVWPEGIARWGGGWVRNQSTLGKYYDRPDVLALCPNKGAKLGGQLLFSSDGEFLVLFSIGQMVANLVGELDVETIETQGVTDIAYYMGIATKPVQDGLALGLIGPAAESSFAPTTALGWLAWGGVAVGGALLLRKVLSTKK